MYPMIEMLASPGHNEPRHIAFIPDILYLYNDTNPINDGRMDSGGQYLMTKYILSLKPYNPINSALLKHH